MLRGVLVGQSAPSQPRTPPGHGRPQCPRCGV